MDKVNILLLVIAYIAMFNCIVRSDYNVVIAITSYFYWSSRHTKTQRVAYIIIIILAAATVFDVIWLVLIWKSWTGKEWASPVWNRLRFWHITVIFFTILNMLVKLVAIFFIRQQEQRSGNADFQRERKPLIQNA